MLPCDFSAQRPNASVICVWVKPKRAVYGAFAMIPDVAALTIKNGTFACVETCDIAMAFGVYDVPTIRSTLS